jgi:2-keto-3-deoxy-L-rhamnonate aldolase RhmA
MNDWGHNFDEYAKTANDKIAVVVMIESLTAIENVDEIANVPGVDGLFIGPYDLSGSYGVVGQMTHPTVLNGRRRVIEAARDARISAGIHLVGASRQVYETAVQDGFTFICIDGDIIFLDKAAKNGFGYSTAEKSALNGLHLDSHNGRLVPASTSEKN